MPRKKSIELPEPISKYFANSTNKVFRYADLVEILASYKHDWGLPSNTTIPTFIDSVLDQSEMSSVKLSFPHRGEIRYLWGNVSEYELALSLRPNSYLSHQSAVYLNGLTDLSPKNVYINHEQPPKRTHPSSLQQDRIDLAFSRKCRITTMKAKYDKTIIWILNGMHTGQLGVIEIIGPKGEKIRSTNIERTLIDIAVRPIYAGGTSEVLKAYEVAVAGNKVSVSNMVDALKKLNYIYPYHQVLGFYLDRAGEDGAAFHHEFEIKYDFYLAHHMSEPLYSHKWRLYYPKEFGAEIS
jgi:hypothetical protein